ncbi:MAG: hypothetical protein AAB456_03085, partial [Patescibacteria group bacterium]
KKLIDLYPQADRDTRDRATRRYAEPFDAKKLLKQKEISIESSEGTLFIRINWRHRATKVLHTMDSRTANGTWAAVAGTTGIKAQTLIKISGSASLEFDLAAANDGISNTGISVVDLTDEDEIADVFLWVHIPNSTALTRFTSATIRWGNDITANYWQSAAVTKQADDSAFKVGWNLLKFAWSDATETGTVAPATIDSFRIIFNISAAITNLKVDNILFAVGKDFDLKYFSQYPFKNAAGTFIIRPTIDDDTVVYVGTTYQIFLIECRIAITQQVIKDPKTATLATQWERFQLNGDPQSPDPIMRMGLYAKYRKEYPAQTKKAINTWGSIRSPNLRDR